MLDQVKTKNFQKSIIITLAYFEQFAFPLKTGELWLRLICVPTVGNFMMVDRSRKPRKKFGKWADNVRNGSSSIAIQSTRAVSHQLNRNHDKHLFARDLAELHDRSLVQFIKPYWRLDSAACNHPGHRGSQLHQHRQNHQRQQRQKYSDQKLAQFWPIVLAARTLPWIAGLAITGSVAVGNASKNDDVDVMIVAENNRLWLVRPIIIVLSFFFGRRRSWNKEEPNSWCFNLWLERQSVQMPLESRSTYTAYEICQTKWLVSKDHVRREFFTTNRWVGSLLPNHHAWALHTAANYERKSNIGGLIFIREVLNILNVVAFQIQYLYMRRHITRERVGYTSAFFHPRDTGKIINTNWLEQASTINGTT